MNVLASILSALLLALAVPNELAPYGNALVAFVALVPYFIALRRSRSYRHAAFLGFIFGSLSHASSSYWLYYFKDFAFWTIGSTSIAYGVLHMLVAGFLHWASVTRFERLFWQPCIPARTVPEYRWGTSFLNMGSIVQNNFSVLRPFVLALGWTTWEWGKSIGFLGYPWGLVAYGLNNYPRMTQIVDGLGVYGLSFFLALASALLVELGSALNTGIDLGKKALKDLSAWARTTIIWLLLFIWFAGYGSYRLAHPTPVLAEVPLLLIQHNADSWMDGELSALGTAVRLSREGMEQYEKETGIRKPVLLVWSETVLRRPFADYLGFYKRNPKDDPLVPFLAEQKVPLLTGAPVVLNWETYDATNSVIFINPDSTISYSYAKRHPVPFAEAIPFWEYQWMRDFMAKVVGVDGTWTMGTEAVVMEVKTSEGTPIRFGTPICFEDAFADVCRDFFKDGADLLINLTNDSWSQTVSSETQHLVAARFRAIENRRVLVRSTNGGITAVIDAEGRVIKSLPPFTEQYLATVVPVQKADSFTTYYLLGDWFAALVSLVFFCLIFVNYVKTHRFRAL
ncbi:apolipoprotein N-acyltransferase [Gracilinema caldarium]|uniref:Apolipoprotein N-acyltransferase n=1 Tax=Gracilinema caldarium (strain ATCC 51460 / DSM 7334 / H1) TaxID=744872 RepID=F8F2R4_GRAC1|nr:apolipoprotein N-acyltransferase [Gracilinema caldarium]AEJ19458.1 Apolipoprotein N-acyltransferase [Gracilinema caldarium DSM 7334]